MILLTGYLQLSVLLIGVAFFQMSMAELLGRKRYREYTIILVGQRAAQIALGISLYFLYGIDGIIFGYTISFLAFSYRYFLTVKHFRPDIQHMRTNFKFMIHSYAMELARTGSMFSDKLLPQLRCLNLPCAAYEHRHHTNDCYIDPEFEVSWDGAKQTRIHRRRDLSCYTVRDHNNPW